MLSRGIDRSQCKKQYFLGDIDPLLPLLSVIAIFLVSMKPNFLKPGKRISLTLMKFISLLYRFELE
jgi:uncharacterized membrane protein (GlpM family)